MTNSRVTATRDILIAYWPVLLAVLLVLPRLINPEFGLFDDPAAIRYSQDIQRGDWGVLSNDADSGRFRPLYWLQYATTYLVAGERPFWFYVVNSLVFVFLTAELIWLLRRLGVVRLQAGISGALFVLAGPVVENIYTLMKPELLQFALILGALLPLAAPAKDAAEPRRIAVLAVLSFTLLLFAAMAKETTLLMLPISAAWLVLAWLGSSDDTKRSELIRWGALVAAALAATGVYFVIRGQFLEVSLFGGTYSGNFEWSVSRFTDSSIRWSGWLVRDFAWLVPLGVLIAVDLVDRRLDQARLLIGALVWVGAWIVIYIPWEFAVEYYLLPVALGVSVVAGIAIRSAIERIKVGNRRWLAWVTILIATPLWLASLSNNLSNAKQQLAVDVANTRALEYIGSRALSEGVVVINIQDENEYVYEIQAYLDALSDVDSSTVRVFSPASGLPSEADLLAVPAVLNQPLLAVRMGVIEPTQQAWNRNLFDTAGDLGEPDFVTKSTFRLSVVDLPRLLCPLMPGRGYCQAERPYFDTREFQYGWSVYHIEQLESD